MAANQIRASFVGGFYPTTATGGIGAGTNATLNTGAAWFSYGFVIEQAKTLSTVKILCSSVSGSLGTSDILCSIYSDSSGIPGSSLASSSSVTGTWGTLAYMEFTGFSLALTAGNVYHVVISNGNSTQGTNYPVLCYGNNGTLPPFSFFCEGQTTYGWSNAYTTNSGGSWTKLYSGVAVFRLKFSDGTTDGALYSATGYSSSVVYSTRECGVKFTTNPGSTLLLRGALLYFYAAGTPTGAPRMRVYNGTTLLSTSNSMPTGAANYSGGYYGGYFPAGVPLLPNTVYRVTLGETSNSDSSSNKYEPYVYTWDTDSGSLALLPFNGTWEQTYYNGSTWADTSGTVPCMALLLDTTGETSPKNYAA